MDSTCRQQRWSRIRPALHFLLLPLHLKVNPVLSGASFRPPYIQNFSSCQRMAEGSQQTSAEPLVPHESAINLMAARVGDFAAAIDLMGGTGLQDTPVEGPRTVNWVCRFMLRHAGSPTRWHTCWRQMTGLQDTDAGVSMHKSMCRLLELSVCDDHLHVELLASTEFMVRQTQEIEERWLFRVYGGASDSSSGPSLHSDTAIRGLLCISPEFIAWRSEEIKKNAVASRNKRKAQEEPDRSWGSCSAIRGSHHPRSSP